MKRLLMILVVLFGLIGFNSCGVSEKDYDILQKKNLVLESKLDSCLVELDECKFGANRLLSKAKEYFKDGLYPICEKTLLEIIEKHIGSNEAIESERMLVSIKSIQDSIETFNKEQEEIRINNEKKRIAIATKKMRKSYDDVRDITWYYAKSSPRYSNRNSFHLYVGKRTGSSSASLRLLIQYTADDWLFIDNYIIVVDGVNYTISEEKSGEITTDHSGGKIWEVLDRSVSESEYEIIKAVANGKKVKIRHNGSKHYRDRTITSREKQALKDVIDVWESLGGEI